MIKDLFAICGVIFVLYGFYTYNKENDEAIDKCQQTCGEYGVISCLNTRIVCDTTKRVHVVTP